MGNISEQVLSGIVESIEAAVVLHAPDLKLLFVNDSYEKAFEIPEQDTMSRSPTDSLPEFDERHKETTFSRLQNTLVTGVKSPYHELSCCFPYGKYQRLLALSIPVLDNHREITHIMSVIHHITCREAGAKGGESEDEMGTICQKTF